MLSELKAVTVVLLMVADAATGPYQLMAPTYMVDQNGQLVLGGTRNMGLRLVSPSLLVPAAAGPSPQGDSLSSHLCFQRLKLELFISVDPLFVCAGFFFSFFLFLFFCCFCFCCVPRLYLLGSHTFG